MKRVASEGNDPILVARSQSEESTMVTQNPICGISRFSGNTMIATPCSLETSSVLQGL